MLDHKYIVFYHLAKNPNTTKVAEEIGLSQPAISKSIKELERELSVTLFLREKGRMQLTETGQYLLEEVSPLLQKEREIRFELDKRRHTFSGTLHIGASTTLAQYVLPELLSDFIRRNPGIRIHLFSGNTDQIEQQVLAGNLHLAFIEGTPTQPDIRYIPFISDEIVLIGAASSTLPEQITPEQFRELNFVFREKGSGTYNIIRRQLSQAGIDPAQLHTRLTLGSTEGIKHFLRHNSDSYALMSIYSVRDELASGKLRIFEIEGLTIDRTFYAIHRQGEPDPYARQFLDFALQGKK